MAPPLPVRVVIMFLMSVGLSFLLVPAFVAAYRKIRGRSPLLGGDDWPTILVICYSGSIVSTLHYVWTHASWEEIVGE